MAFVGCPNVEDALTCVRQAIADEGVRSRISLMEIDTPELAISRRFLGSPSVRIDGMDVEIGADLRTDYGLTCRTYRDGVGVSGTPTIELVRQAIRRAVIR